VRRRINIGLVLLFGLLLVLAVAAGAAWRSPAAAAWVLQRVPSMVPGELALEGITGSFADGLAFEQIEYRLDELSVDVQQARVVVGWPALLRGELQLRRLLAAEVVVRQAAAGSSEPVIELPEIELPLALSVDSLRLDRLELAIGALAETLTDIRARARWSDTRLSIQRLEATRPGLIASASGDVEFAGRWPLSLALQWQLDDPAVSGEGRVSGDVDRLEIQQRVRIPDEVRVSGSVDDLLGDLRADLRADWTALSIELAEDNSASARDGRLTFSGRPDDYQLKLSALLAIEPVPELELSAVARGTLEELVTSRIALRSSFGEALGQLRVGYSPLELKGNFEASDLNPEAFVAGWPGRFDLRLDLEADGNGNFTARLSELTGELRELPVSGAALLQRAGQRLLVEDAELSVGENRLSARLVSTPRLDGRFDIDASDLSALWPGLAGSATGSGRITGLPESPQLEARLAGTAVSYQGQSIDRLDLRAAIDPEQRLDIALNAAGISSGELALGDLALTARGAPQRFATRVELQGGPLRALVETMGGWEAGRLAQTVERGELEADLLGAWTLDAPFELRLADEILALAAHCWSQLPAQLCLDKTELADDSQRAALRLKGLPLGPFAALVDEGLTIEGSADASLAYQRRADTWQVDFDGLVQDSLLRFQVGTDEPIETAINEFRASLRANDAIAELRGQLAGDYGLVANLEGKLRDPLDEAGELDLRLLARLPDLSLPAPLLARFLPVERLGGRVEVDLKVTGSPAAPRLGGFARLEDGRAFLPLAGIDIEAAEFSLLPGRGDDLGLLTASAASGGGRVELDGALKLDDERGLFVEAKLSGEGFQAVRFPNQSVYVSPDLELVIDQRLVDVQGSVLVPRARVEVKELPARAQTPSGDIVVHYEIEPPEPRQRYVYGLIGNLELSLGDDVVFRGFGLDTRLGGRLRLARSSIEEPFRANGSLRTIAGRFRAGRRELSIDRGVLIFSGPLDNPSLDVRAVREVTWEGRDYRAGVLLTGPVGEIRTEVFGEPAMGETDALSFLVLGRPATDLSGSAGSELSGSAVALGLVGLLPITEQLQDSLMLDEISFAGSGGEDTSVVAGKRLSEDIFVRYTYGLFDRVGTFLVRYDIGRGFSLEAGSGREQTLEIIYSVDR